MNRLKVYTFDNLIMTGIPIDNYKCVFQVTVLDVRTMILFGL